MWDRPFPHPGFFTSIFTPRLSNINEIKYPDATIGKKTQGGWGHNPTRVFFTNVAPRISIIPGGGNKKEHAGGYQI